MRVARSVVLLLALCSAVGATARSLREAQQASAADGPGLGPLFGEDFASAKEAFMKKFPAYGYPNADASVDELWESEGLAARYGNRSYFDYAASAPYWDSTVENAGEDFLTHDYTSNSASVKAASDALRNETLAFFGASPDEYLCIWTRSASGSLQSVGNVFPFTKASRFAYLNENHISLLGIRENAKVRGAKFGQVTQEQVDKWLASPKGDAAPSKGNGTTYHLFGYPSMDNLSGKLLPLDWVGKVKARSTDKDKWLVLLDTTATVITKPFSLKETPADFATVSFYKMTGYPTGVGALLMRKDAAAAMAPVFSGGLSTTAMTPSLDWRLLSAGASRFEDGTLPYLNIVAIRQVLAAYKRLGGPQAVDAHTGALKAWLYDAAQKLKHSNGAPLLQLNSPPGNGATLNVNVVDPQGKYFSHIEVGNAAAAAGIDIGKGCAANPGTCYSSVGLRDDEIVQLLEQNNAMYPATPEFAVVTRDENGANKEVKLPTGTNRASLGYMSRFEDVWRLINFLQDTYKDKPVDVTSTANSVVLESKAEQQGERLALPGARCLLERRNC